MIRAVVVDDDYRVASIHAAYLGKIAGFEAIAEAHTAAEAVAAVDSLKPDLLLLDLYLPDEHGLDLVARLRGGDHPQVDIIVITAAKDADSVRAALQQGALHYLLKPFSFPGLRDKLQSYRKCAAALRLWSLPTSAASIGSSARCEFRPRCRRSRACRSTRWTPCSGCS